MADLRIDQLSLRPRPNLQLRLITPVLAIQHPDIQNIPTFTDNSLSLARSLRELKLAVLRHLGLPSDNLYIQDEGECNCSFATEIFQNCQLSHGQNPSKNLVVVHGCNEVILVKVDSLPSTNSERINICKSQLPDQMQGKHISVIESGLPGSRSSNTQPAFSRLSVISCCSPRRHEPETSESDTNGDITKIPPTNLDIHTVEAPLELTSANANLRISDTGLDELIFNGTLDLYIVPRVGYPERDCCYEDETIDEWFLSEDAWTQTPEASERGLCMFLSTLRVFAKVIGPQQMDDDNNRDSVLHVVHTLTRFPPAVRAVAALMFRRSLRYSERAALIQCVRQLLRVFVPMDLIGGDQSRLLEASRLLFGFILDKAKSTEWLKWSERYNAPYFRRGCRLMDNRNKRTMDTVLFPYESSQLGLVERGYYVALQSRGPLDFSDRTSLGKTEPSRGITKRVVILSGGVIKETHVFNSAALLATIRNYDRFDQYRDNDIMRRALQNFPSLTEMAGMAARDRLAVVPPVDLRKSSAPVLTLDEEGLLAVYLERAACAPPDCDFTIFRPTRDGEHTMDVSEVTQKLVPILRRRENDGTDIFDAFGEQRRQHMIPNEVIMICVDCSSSMKSPSELTDPSIPRRSTYTIWKRHIGNLAGCAQSSSPILALRDLKDFIRSHESFGEMLAIVSSAHTTEGRRRNARQVLAILYDLDLERLKDNLRRVGRAPPGLKIGPRPLSFLDLDIRKWRTRAANVEYYEKPLVDFLVNRAGIAWEPTQCSSTADTLYAIPQHMKCPISYEFMDDPVTIGSGNNRFAYSRSSISGWLKTASTCPQTGMAITDPTLRPDLNSKWELDRWVNGTDILQNYDSKQLPAQMSMRDLHVLTFRRMRGRYSNFILSTTTGGRRGRLSPSDATIQSILHDNCTLHIVTESTGAAVTKADVQHCWVQVHREREDVVRFSIPTNTTKSMECVIWYYWKEIFRRNTDTVVKRGLTIIHSFFQESTEMSSRGEVKIYPWDQLAHHLFGGSGHVPHDLRHSNTHEPVLKLILRYWEPEATVSLAAKNPLTRLDVLKQMFEAFINRLIAYNYRTHIGLVTIRSSSAVSQELTHALEDFRDAVQGMEASRGTALYDGIDLAVEELVRYSATYPDEHMIKKRIICLTDGEDNRSRKKVYEVSRHLQDNGVILDAVCLRGSWKSNLETLSYLTGGYRFRPKTINDVMTICELEPVLSLHERPDIILPTEARQYADSGIRFQNAKVALSSARDHGETNDDTLPPLRPEPEFDESFVRVRVFKRNLSSDVQAEHNADLARGIKILDQVRLAAEHNQDNYDIYICERNFRFWKIVMTGPDGSAYENGTFLLTLKIAKEHPAFPPEARFVTPTYHPNVNKHGKVCHSVLDRDWTADTKITHVLDNIFTLLLVPEFLDPVNTLPTLDYHHDPVEFREQVAEHVQEHATRTREEWRRVIEKGDVEMS